MSPCCHFDLENSKSVVLNDVLAHAAASPELFNFDYKGFSGARVWIDENIAHAGRKG